MIGLEWRAIQWSEFGGFTRVLPSDYFSFSLDPSLGAFDFSPGEGLPPSGASAGAASTLILVLSGKPYAPLVTTLSPSLTPSRICTSSPWRTPSFTAF